MPTVRVHDPKKPGDFLTVEASDVEKRGYTLWTAPKPAPPEADPTAETVELEGQDERVIAQNFHDESPERSEAPEPKPEKKGRRGR